MGPRLAGQAETEEDDAAATADASAGTDPRPRLEARRRSSPLPAASRERVPQSPEQLRSPARLSTGMNDAHPARGCRRARRSITTSVRSRRPPRREKAGAVGRVAFQVTGVRDSTGSQPQKITRSQRFFTSPSVQVDSPTCCTAITEGPCPREAVVSIVRADPLGQTHGRPLTFRAAPRKAVNQRKPRGGQQLGRARDGRLERDRAVRRSRRWAAWRSPGPRARAPPARTPSRLGQFARRSPSIADRRRRNCTVCRRSPR